MTSHILNPIVTTYDKRVDTCFLNILFRRSTFFFAFFLGGWCVNIFSEEHQLRLMMPIVHGIFSEILYLN